MFWQAVSAGQKGGKDWSLREQKAFGQLSLEELEESKGHRWEHSKEG